MYCPNCAQENSTEQKFCRKCGLNLERSAESLLEQRPDRDAVISNRRLERFGNIAFGGLGLVGFTAVAAMLYTIVTKFILTGTGVAFGVILSFLLIFAVLGLVYVVLNEVKKEKRSKVSAANMIEKVNGPDTARLLESREFEPIPSITENTTDLLKVEAKTRKF